MNDIHFSRIKISRFRGRNFTLEINPRGQHTVFIMDGNTGKTTTIELLRWCFRYPESEAENRFEHMWNKPAHLLDDTKQGPQTCEIEVQFSAFDEEKKERFFKFNRIIEGEYIPEHPPVGDKIFSINDSLEIDYGIEVLLGDKVNRYLSSNFRFNDCAEYFCFDGEKAREVMQLASDSGKISILLELVNRRVTHPRLEEYKLKLDNLRDRILNEAKSTVTDRAIERNINQLKSSDFDRRSFERKIRNFQDEKNNHDLAIRELELEIESIRKQISQSKTKNLIELNRYEMELKNIENEINETREDIYKRSIDWINTDMMDTINEIKNILKEKGKLPEPYRSDLINTCLKTDVCQICGRKLDEKSRERVETLGSQVAPHEVHKFLDSNFSPQESKIDSRNINYKIMRLINQYNETKIKIKGIELSEHDKNLIFERDNLIDQKDQLVEKRDNLIKEIAKWDEHLRVVKHEIRELEERLVSLREYKIILDQIEISKNIIQDTAEIIKKEAINIISDIISEGVQSILGKKFSARLSQEDGLMLGEDGFYGKEKGGYSGRLILSYCFAEAMTLVDPLIVDTPVGNIGTQRPKLAEHLFANHNQVILLCLPTELYDFAPTFSDNPIEIVNKEV